MADNDGYQKGTLIMRALYPLAHNQVYTVNTTKATKTIFSGKTANGLPSGFTQSDVLKARIILNIAYLNRYNGANDLDLTTATDNQFKVQVNSGGFTTMLDGQMSDGDWEVDQQNAGGNLTLSLDVTSLLSDITTDTFDAEHENAVSDQNSFKVIVDAWLEVYWQR